MNTVIQRLLDLGYIRLGTQLTKPVIINCVPGAGKTTLIRELIAASPLYLAYTTGVPDPATLQGCQIRKWEGRHPEGHIILLDEYQNLPELPTTVDFAFGDPLQSCNPNVRTAQFISYKTYRFGTATADLLSRLGYKIEAEKQDTVIIGDIYKNEPVGQIICFEEEVADLLRAHQADFISLRDCIGKTFRQVTFYTAGRFDIEHAHEHFICLTRHSELIQILCPDAQYLN